MDKEVELKNITTTILNTFCYCVCRQLFIHLYCLQQLFIVSIDYPHSININ